ncbi:MAG TPA: rod shape-determining protein RodA [Candidatus Paceibacterota bacterium]
MVFQASASGGVLEAIKRVFLSTDWILLGAAVLLSLAGLITMHSLNDEFSYFDRQLIWIPVSVLAAFVCMAVDWRFLRRSNVVMTIYVITLSVLGFLFLAGSVFHGARAWFSFGPFSFQPSDPAKLALVILLAKYFTRRHVAIKDFHHIIVSGVYTALLVLLVLLQPDFGAAVILFGIWAGMLFVSGISKRHILAVFAAGLVVFSILWGFVFAPYQKARIVSFLHPTQDIRGAGYNAFQSVIAVGSGEIFGKGVGYGTQSKLKFLPEYQTDFIFAAFAEEWGLVGSIIFLTLFSVVIWRICLHSYRAATNFEALFSLGVAVYLSVHAAIHVGMNIGLLPITGTPMPFVSYGGSHLLTEYVAIGIVISMASFSRATHREKLNPDDSYVLAS